MEVITLYNGNKSPRPRTRNNWIGEDNATINKKPRRLNYSDSPATEFAESELWDTIKPIFVAMAFFGLFFPPKAEGVTCQKYLKQQKILQTYSYVMCAILLGYFIKYCFAFTANDTFGEALFFKICLLSFFCQTFFQAACCHHVFRCKDRVSSFFFQYVNVIAKESEQFPQQKKLVKMFLAGSAFLVLCCTVFYGYAIYFDEFMSPVFMSPFLPTGEFVQITRFITLFCLFLSMGAWLFPLLFMLVVAEILGCGFARYNAKLEKEINEDPTLVGRIRRLRHTHQRLCTMTDTADDIFKYIAAAFVTCSCIQFLVLLYILITSSGAHFQTLIGHMFAITNVSVGLIVLCIFAGRLNHEAHESKKLLYRVELGDDQEEAREFLVFLERVEGSSMGLSVMDMFVIDKPTILTIFGALMSYFMILLTFNPSSDACNANGLSKTLVFLREVNGTFVASHNITV